MSRTVHTTSPVERVAPYLADFTTSVEWDPHTRACRRVSGDGDGPVEVGTEYDNTQRIGLMSTTMRYRVEAHEPGRRIVLQSHSGTLDATDMMTFDADGGGAAVTYTAKFRLKGLARVAAPVLRVVLNKVADDGAAGMQQRLDALGQR